MSSSDNSEHDEVLEIDWDSLKGQLSAGALEGLQQHLQEEGRGQDEVDVSIDGKEGQTGVVAIPASNLSYKVKDYWNNRFQTEEEYDWLASYGDMADHVRTAVPKASRVLVVGCGNSGLSADMYDDGYRDMLSTDFSAVVVEKMRERHRSARPGLRWDKMDMLALDMEDESVDAVVDKAAMDALTVDKRDPWNPDESVVAQCHKMCGEVSRVLAPGGVFLQLSFEQDHFRRKLLLGEHVRGNGSSSSSNSCGVSDSRNGSDSEAGRGGVYGWDLTVHNIRGEKGCFGQFLYVMRKRGRGSSAEEG